MMWPHHCLEQSVSTAVTPDDEFTLQWPLTDFSNQQINI